MNGEAAVDVARDLKRSPQAIDNLTYRAKVALAFRLTREGI